MEKVTSADGTTIAYDRVGTGSPVILVGGALCDRNSHRPLAEALADEYEVITYDRRGRGDSGDTAPYDVQREVEDIAALLTATGGTTAIYGHSSGAALAAIAAVTLPFSQVVMHEPPYGPDNADTDDDGGQVIEALRDGRNQDAVEQFLLMTGLPKEVAQQVAATPGLADVAPTLPYDFAVMGHALDHGGTPVALLRRVTPDTLVLAGTATAPFMIDAAHRVTEILPNATYADLPGQQHAVPPEALAPVLKNFLRR
ncbi:alpha/beta fold hydrolase [Kribbella sp. NPDC059898]|uniref:alpha/beta fold hydrolase n=1 Tax=Kribbella sp. NPDC059898 TaxID=3346995 RepID=UPI00364F9E42